MDETRLFETLDECDRLTADAFAGWKAATDARLAERFGCAIGELRPWHYEDPFFQEVPAAGGVDLTDVFAGKDVVALARATYDGLGVDTNAILDRSDLFPRDGKCQHAFCIDVDREGDVRVLANVARRPLLGGHDAPRARARRLRHRLRPGRSRGSCATATSPSPRASRS